jgi:anti-sigma-K factor RskA
MDLMKNPSLVQQLAASYALGTLRGGARRRFEALARDDAVLRAAALVWQSRMASMAELQPPMAPSPAVWKRIENLVNADQQAAALKAARAQPVAVPAVGWWASLGLWRGATAAGVLMAVVAVVTGMSANTRVDQLSAEVAQLSGKLAATPEIQYVAVLADDKSSASMLVTFDPKTSKLVLKRVGGFQEQADKSLQLWALPPGASPRSLGVLGRDAVVRLTAADRDVREVPTLAISLEPKGGVTDGNGPSGPVLFKGALIETAP